MWIFLLLRLMAEERGVVPQAAEELTVYRSRAELPPAWRAAVPDAFDFEKELLATAARPPQAVELSGGVARTEVHRGALYVWLTPPPPREPRQCPPCRGIHTNDELLDRGVSAAKVQRAPLLRLPRSSGRIFRVHTPGSGVSAELSPCPPCLAP